MAETQKPQIGSQEAFQRFADTHPNNFDNIQTKRGRRGRHAASRERAANSQPQPRHEAQERRGWRQRAAAMRTLGSKAMDFGYGLVARATIPKSIREHTDAIVAEHEKAAQTMSSAEYFGSPQAARDAKRAQEVLLGRRSQPEKSASQPVETEAAPEPVPVAQEHDSRLRTIGDIPEVHTEAGTGFDEVLDHSEQLATDGDVLVDAVEDHGFDLPHVGDGVENNPYVHGKVKLDNQPDTEYSSPFVSWEGNTAASEQAAQPVAAEAPVTSDEGVDLDAIRDHRERGRRRGRHGESYEEALRRRLNHVARHAEAAPAATGTEIPVVADQSGPEQVQVTVTAPQAGERPARRQPNEADAAFDRLNRHVESLGPGFADYVAEANRKVDEDRARFPSREAYYNDLHSRMNDLLSEQQKRGLRVRRSRRTPARKGRDAVLSRAHEASK